MKPSWEEPGPLTTVAEGARAAVPVGLAYLGIGFAAGALGAREGLSALEVGLLSLLMFAGSAQFIFAELVAGAPVTLVATIFLVNFRHFLYASAFALRTRSLGAGWRTLIGAQLTDETFAVATSLSHQPLQVARGMVALNMCSYSCWVTGTVTGAVVGSGPWADALAKAGIDFALAAMFAALLMLQVTAVARRWPMVAVAAVAAVLMVGLELVRPHPLNLLVATGAAAAFGAATFGKPRMATEQPAPTGAGQ